MGFHPMLLESFFLYFYLKKNKISMIAYLLNKNEFLYLSK